MPAGADLVGLGATAALATIRPRKGEHRFRHRIRQRRPNRALHVRAGQGPTRSSRRRRPRFARDRAVAGPRLRGCRTLAAEPRRCGRTLCEFVAAAGAAVDPIDRLLAGELDRVTVQPDGQMMLSAPQPSVLFPGSFNPMHEGHVLLARVAEELRQQPVAFEISVTNVDKPPLLGRDGATPARAIRLEVAGGAYPSAHLCRKGAVVSGDHVCGRRGYGRAAVWAEILWRRRGSNARRTRGNRQFGGQLSGRGAPRRGGAPTRARRPPRAAALCRSLHRNPRASFSGRHLLVQFAHGARAVGNSQRAPQITTVCGSPIGSDFVNQS